MLAVAICFVSAGLAGVSRPVVDVRIGNQGGNELPPPAVPVLDISASDLADTPEEPPAAAGPPEESLPAEQTPPEPLLTEEDIFEVPPAPPIETALRVLEPVPSKSAPAPPQPQPRRAEPSKPRPAAASPATGGPASPTAGGGGGTVASGRGGKGKFPAPPYPAFARAKGITGTVTLSIKVTSAGDVSSAAVAGSSGSSDLDRHAADWVSRRWKWPAGAARSFRLPVTFRLR